MHSAPSTSNRHQKSGQTLRPTIPCPCAPVLLTSLPYRLTFAHQKGYLEKNPPSGEPRRETNPTYLPIPSFQAVGQFNSALVGQFC